MGHIEACDWSALGRCLHVDVSDRPDSDRDRLSSVPDTLTDDRRCPVRVRNGVATMPVEAVLGNGPESGDASDRSGSTFFALETLKVAVSALRAWLTGDSTVTTATAANASSKGATEPCGTFAVQTPQEIRAVFEAWVDADEEEVDVEPIDAPCEPCSDVPVVVDMASSSEAPPLAQHVDSSVRVRPVNASPEGKATMLVEGWAALCDPANADCAQPRFNVGQCLLNIRQALGFSDIPRTKIRDVLLSGKVVGDVNIPPAFLNHGLPERLNLVQQYVRALHAAIKGRCVTASDVFNVIFARSS